MLKTVLKKISLLLCLTVSLNLICGKGWDAVKARVYDPIVSRNKAAKETGDAKTGDSTPRTPRDAGSESDLGSSTGSLAPTVRFTLPRSDSRSDLGDSRVSVDADVAGPTDPDAAAIATIRIPAWLRKRSNAARKKDTNDLELSRLAVDDPAAAATAKREAAAKEDAKAAATQARWEAKRAARYVTDDTALIADILTPPRQRTQGTEAQPTEDTTARAATEDTAPGASRAQGKRPSQAGSPVDDDNISNLSPREMAMAQTLDAEALRNFAAQHPEIPLEKPLPNPGSVAGSSGASTASSTDLDTAELIADFQNRRTRLRRGTMADKAAAQAADSVLTAGGDAQAVFIASRSARANAAKIGKNAARIFRATLDETTGDTQATRAATESAVPENQNAPDDEASRRHNQGVDYLDVLRRRAERTNELDDITALDAALRKAESQPGLVSMGPLREAAVNARRELKAQAPGAVTSDTGT